jgi:lysophospholipase L1-like esterase
MKVSLSLNVTRAVALAAFSLLGCSSNDASTSSAPGSGGSLGGATASGGVGAGGSSIEATDSGGATSNGGTPATGGQSQANSLAQGGSAAGGETTSTPGRTGGSVAGGGATGGEVITGGVPTGGAPTGGKTAAGGTTSGGAPTGGKTAAGGTTSGGAPTGGKTAAGGTTSGGTTTSGTVTIGDASVARVLGASDGKTPVTVWMAGDSTMSGSGCTGGGWGTQFASVFNSSVKVVNSSVAGRSIQTWLYDPNVGAMDPATGECTVSPKTYNPRWTAMLDANTGMKPGDYLFIEFGINDAETTCQTGKTRHVGSALFQTYLTTMAQAAMDRGAQPIFLTSMSGLQCSGSTAQPNRAFGPETKAAGAADNVEVIDMTTISAALYTSLGLCPSSGTSSGASGAFFCNDTTHFEQAGALQIAKAVAKALKDQGIGLGAYVLN